MNYSHKVTGLANVISFKDYGYRFDAMLVQWLKAKFNLTVEHDCYTGYNVWEGDYDLDIPSAFGKTIFSAALEYASCYEGALFDKLIEVESGRT